MGAIKAIQDSKGPSIAGKVATAHQKQMVMNRIALSKIFETLNVLGQQVISLRGADSDEHANFVKILKMRGNDCPELRQWLTSAGSKWTSHDIQNEILSILSTIILQKLLTIVRESDFFSILLDETPDSASREQLSICVVSEDFVSSEYFLGFYNIKSTTANALMEVVKDVFVRFQFEFSKLRGQCYDGAANMSGRLNGLHTKVLKCEPRALYVHCNAHNLNLVVQDAITSVP